MVAEVAFLGMLFLGQAVFFVFVLKKAGEMLDATLDTMSKLAQIVSIHQKSRNAAEAVEQTLTLESNLRALDAAEKAMAKDSEKKTDNAKRPVGFRDPGGKIVKFLTPADDKLLSRIPKDRLVYE